MLKWNVSKLIRNKNNKIPVFRVTLSSLGYKPHVIMKYQCLLLKKYEAGSPWSNVCEYDFFFFFNGGH